ncbi:glutaredoxin [Pseudoloma neurophilia]|uniref:Glutaredoxin n=1 Tax=Pseudoloma neurophilia TaxID=146866 RepID=A0A0R0LXU2_9MICR|nr:glutaredoxin [Pseudoloma neurophilia]
MSITETNYEMKEEKIPTESIIQMEKRSILIGFDECPYCQQAMAYLDDQQIPYDYFERKDTIELQKEVLQNHKHKTFPMIWLKGEWVGGFDNLKQHI